METPLFVRKQLQTVPVTPVTGVATTHPIPPPTVPPETPQKIWGQMPCRWMESFDSEGSPTDKTLETIKHWPIPADLLWAELIDYCREAWNMEFGDVRDETVGRSKVVSFITGGRRENEAILVAMAANQVFYASCWHSSERGGLVRILAPV